MKEKKQEELEKILEAIIFVQGRVISWREIKQLLPDWDSKDIKKALQRLQNIYQNRGINLREVAGGFRFETSPQVAKYIKKIKTKETRLSKASLETLAIIAYKQPITKAEIESIRGVDSGGALKSLLEKRLIKIAGRKSIPGRPILYATTKRFLEVFGLQDLKELPPLKELEEIISHAQKD